MTSISSYKPFDPTTWTIAFYFCSFCHNYAPINKKFISNPTDEDAVALSVPPERESPVPTVISSITPVPDVVLPINLLVAIDVDIVGVVPPEEVIGLVAPTLVTVPPLEGLVFVIVKLGYVPVILIPVPEERATV